MFSWLHRRLPRLRRVARPAGWLGILLFAFVTVLVIRGRGEGPIGPVVLFASMVSGGVFVAVEWGLAVLVIGRVTPIGPASLGYELIARRRLVLQGAWVRVLGAVWLLAGSAVMAIGLAGLVAPIIDRVQGPGGVAAAKGAEVQWDGHSLQVPVGAEVREDPPRLGVVVAPTARANRRLELAPWSGSGGGYDGQAVLAPDEAGRRGWVGWRIAVRGTGSGGEEQEACGRLMREGVDLAFCCFDQDELAPDPTWCLPWLASVRRNVR